MVLRLIAEQEVICTTCRKSVNYENSAIHACEGPAPAVAPQPQQPVVDPEPAQAMRQILEDAQAGKIFTRSGEDMYCICENEAKGVNRWKNCAVQNWWKGMLTF